MGVKAGGKAIPASFLKIEGRGSLVGAIEIRGLKPRVGRECSISRGGPDCTVEVYLSKKSEEGVTVLRQGKAPRVRAS